MSFTYDLSTNIGKIRNMINDTVEASAQLTDEEINSFLAIFSSDLFQTAAQCLLKIAASKAILAKRKSAGNYSEDLSAISRECREVAKMFKDMAREIPAEATAEQFLTDFAYNDVLLRKDLREETE